MERHPQPGDVEISVSEFQQAIENMDLSLFSEHVTSKSDKELHQHPKTISKCQFDTGIDSVGLLPVCEGKMGLIRVFRHPLGRSTWETIKGYVRPGEHTSDTTARELLKLNGFFENDHKLLDIGIISTEGEGIKDRSRCFVVELQQKREKSTCSEIGHVKIEYFRQEEIDKLIVRSEIEDTTTLAILLIERLKKTNPVLR